MDESLAAPDLASAAETVPSQKCAESELMIVFLPLSYSGCL